MMVQDSRQPCGLCFEEKQSHGQLTLCQFGVDGYRHDVRLCATCYTMLSKMIFELLQGIIQRELADLQQQMARLKI
jgi:hypothetical protein